MWMGCGNGLLRVGREAVVGWEVGVVSGSWKLVDIVGITWSDWDRHSRKRE